MNDQVDIQKRFFDFVSDRHSPEEVLHTTMEVLHLYGGIALGKRGGLQKNEWIDGLDS